MSNEYQRRVLRFPLDDEQTLALILPRRRITEDEWDRLRRWLDLMEPLIVDNVSVIETM